MYLLTKRDNNVSRESFADIKPQESPEEQVESLRAFLGYPALERDRKNRDYWYLRPGADQDEAKNTAPIGICFYNTPRKSETLFDKFIADEAHDVDLFRQLGELGEQLVNLHLMKSPALDEISSPFIDNGGSCIVEHPPKYESGKVVVNKQKDGFMDVPEAVWNFHVGGYQVCHKWLKDRKGRTLSQDDIGHYQKIVVALGQSIKLMKQIDEAIPSWPIDAQYN